MTWKGRLLMKRMANNSLDGGEGLFTDGDVQEFIQIYKQEFREELSLKAAREMATGLLELYSVLANPLPDKTHLHFDQQISKGKAVRFPSPPLTKVIDILSTKKPEM
jgi:hypothetical protein